MADVIAALEHAVLRVVSVNETAFDQLANPDGTPTLDDPLKQRIGAYATPDGKFYIGCISMDVLRRQGDGLPHRTEVGFLKFAVDEMVDRDGDPVPMVELFLTQNIHDSSDQAMQRVFTASRKGVTFHVPVMMLGGTIASGKVTRFYTDGGMYCVNMQDDPIMIGNELKRVIRAVKYLIVPTEEHPNIVTGNESTWVSVGEATL